MGNGQGFELHPADNNARKTGIMEDESERTDMNIAKLRLYTVEKKKNLMDRI